LLLDQKYKSGGGGGGGEANIPPLFFLPENSFSFCGTELMWGQ